MTPDPGSSRRTGAPRWSDVALRAAFALLPRRLRFRFLAAYWARVDHESRIVRRSLPGGIDLALDLGDWICAHLYYLGRYEPDTLRWLRDACRSGDVVVEAGAHVGYFTVWCDRWVGPSGSVHAFEPCARTRALLERNLERNGAGAVRVSGAALSSREGAGSLALENVHNYGTAWLSAEAGGGEPVETVTLDAYAERTGLDRVDVVKIDVQGHEVEVIEGMDRVLRGNPSARVLVELDEALLRRSGATRDRVVAALGSRGFVPASTFGEPGGATGDRPIVAEFRGPGRRSPGVLRG